MYALRPTRVLSPVSVLESRGPFLFLGGHSVRLGLAPQDLRLTRRKSSGTGGGGGAVRGSGERVTPEFC